MEEQSPKTIEYAELLLQEGKIQEARLLLAAYIKRNPSSVRAWWVMSRAVEDAEQELFCLERVLRLDPAHDQARLRVATLKTPPTPDVPPPPSQLPAAPAVSPFVFSDDEPEPEEQGFDLFSQGVFQQPAPVSSPASRPAADLEPAARKASEVPSWAEPPAPPQGPGPQVRPAAPRKKRTWIVDAVVISVILCALIAVVAYFGLYDMGQTMLRSIQETQEVAQILTSRPPQTLEPTWTPSATFTSIPTETFTPTLTPFTPTITPTLLYTLTKTSIPSSAVGVTTGMYPPDFTLMNVATGAQVSLSDYAGKPILLFFWATWCPYCNEEIPTLKDIYAAYKDDGLIVLAVNGGDSFSEVDSYRTSYGLTFPMLLDHDYDVSITYKANSIPYHVFIGLNGRIMFVVTGELFYSDLENKVKATMRVFPTPTP
ncbi:MAG: redoxin domain-containing protein [Chloroflexi bacterium]|nr:redoxin domain-containing protein [Chloroflexota bacterium]